MSATDTNTERLGHMIRCRNHTDRAATYTALMPTATKQPDGSYLERVPVCDECAPRIQAILGGYPFEPIVDAEPQPRCPECDELLAPMPPKAGSKRWVCDTHGVWSDPA